MATLVYIVTTMLALQCWATIASESSAELMLSSINNSLSTLGRSFCSLENNRDLISRISFDMERIGWDLASTITEIQQQRIKFHGKRDLVALSCRQSALCLNTFSLKSVLKTKVAQDVGYIVDFMAINDHELMYLVEGIPNFIQCLY